MGEKQTQTITIDNTEYNVADLSDQSKALLNHINDLDRKISSTQFNLDQLNVGRQAFGSMLRDALAEKTDDTTETVN